jgi:hypothetical protein
MLPQPHDDNCRRTARRAQPRDDGAAGRGHSRLSSGLRPVSRLAGGRRIRAGRRAAGPLPVAPTPFSLYHAELWTILHQALAVLLRIGFSEILLSKLLSGVIGMLSLQALAMVVYAVSGDALVSMGTAGLFFVTRATDFGVLYPIYLMGTSHTYGIVGLSYRPRRGAAWHRTIPAAGFLLGLAPRHPRLACGCC